MNQLPLPPELPALPPDFAYVGMGCLEFNSTNTSRLTMPTSTFLDNIRMIPRSPPTGEWVPAHGSNPHRQYAIRIGSVIAERNHLVLLEPEGIPVTHEF